MSCTYTRTTNFTVKDSLPVDDPDKTVLGEEIQFELDAIAAAICAKADINNNTATGTTTNNGPVVNNDTVTNNGAVTNASTVTTTGAVTNNGTVTNNGATNLNGDVLVDGNTLEDYINSVINSGAAPGTDGQHRYWRIAFGATVNGTAQISDGSIWTGGQGFKNGRRWNKGVLLALPEDVSAYTPYEASGGTSSPTALSWKNFWNGDTATATMGFSTTPPSANARNGVEIDFGEGNKVHISGIDINGVVSGPTETVDLVEFSYSDDGSNWTVASTVSGIKESTGADVDETIDLPHIGNIGDTTPNTLFDESKATIPFLDTSGGGGGGTDYWTFDYTVRDATFTPADKTYYFVAGTSSDDFTVALPTASNGTRVGFCYASDTQGAGTLAVTIEDDSSNIVAYVGRQPTETFPSALFDQGNFITNIELVYAGSGWRVMNVFTYFYVE